MAILAIYHNIFQLSHHVVNKKPHTEPFNMCKIYKQMGDINKETDEVMTLMKPLKS